MMPIPQQDYAPSIKPRAGQSGSSKSGSSKSSSQRHAQKQRHHTANIGRFDHVLEVLSLAVLPLTLLILLLLIVTNLNSNSWTSFRSDSYSKPSLASANENQYVIHAQPEIKRSSIQYDSIQSRSIQYSSVQHDNNQDHFSANNHSHFKQTFNMLARDPAQFHAAQTNARPRRNA